jgi:hypothetical protein
MPKTYPLYQVLYRRKTGNRRILRTSAHLNLKLMPNKEFRLSLLQDYLRTNKRVERIVFHGYFTEKECVFKIKEIMMGKL